MKKKIYPSHKEDLSRLNRVSGQIDGIRKMIENGRYCPEILIQLRAARSALKGIEINILERYLSTCVSNAFASDNKKEKDEKIAELLDLFKRFEG